VVFNRDLRLRVGPQPRNLTGLAQPGQLAAEFMGEGNWSGHELQGFVAGKTEHQSLIAGALLGRAFALGRGVIDTLFNVAGLLAHFANHPAGIGVKNAIAVHISNAANRLANALFEIKLRVARNLAGEHDEVAFGEGLASDATERVLIEDRKSTRLNSSHLVISYAVFCLIKKKLVAFLLFLHHPCLASLRRWISASRSWLRFCLLVFRAFGLVLVLIMLRVVMVLLSFVMV